jgi:phenylacetate-CoA ligase
MTLRLPPPVRRHIVEPFWNWSTRQGLLEAERALDRTQWLPAADVEQRQLKALRALLTEVAAINPFYRARFAAAGLEPAALQSLEEFRRLPVLTKAMVRQQTEDLLSTGFERSSLMRAKTGGSTGKALDLYFTEEVSRLRNAFGRRRRTWAGWQVGEPMGAVWGNPEQATEFRAKLRDWLLGPTITLDTMSMTKDAVRQFEREWRTMRPTLLFGHAHSIYILSCLVDELRLTGIRPNAIVSSSMMLVPHERAVIERVFGTRVTDFYGCEEVGGIASECERHEGMHINADQLIVEVLREDGTPAGPGEFGAVVVTDLLNLAMPMIRYRSCGRGLPTIRRIVGRTADFLVRRDGSRVAGISLIENSLTDLPGIDQMQIVQETLDHVTLRVVPGAGFTPDVEAALTRYFEGQFPGAAIALERVTAIAQEANGKYRFSICRVQP